MKKFVKVTVLSSATLLVFAMPIHRLEAATERACFTDDGNVRSVVGADDPWPAAELMQPEELAKLLSAQQKPAVLQVGIVHLYKIGHIPGAKYAGPANATEGLAELKKQAQSLDRNREVICYCGCCPWVNCPNTRPAYQALREMGFKKIRMLYIAHSFGEDWVTKGYPVEKGA